VNSSTQTPSKDPHLSHPIKVSIPILIDTLFLIQYSSIETEAILKPFLKIVGRDTANKERLLPLEEK